MQPLHRRRSVMETLESRRLLTTSVWTGAAGNHLFSDANNWQGDIAPSSGNDIQFNDIGTPQTVDVDSAATVGNIYISGTYAIGDHTLTLLGDVTANANADVTFSNDITITTNSHFTVDTNAKLQLGTLNDSSSDMLDKYDSGDLILAGNSNATWNLLDDGTLTLAANTHIDLYQYGGTLDGSGKLNSISTSNVQNSVIAPTNTSGPTTITSATNTYVDSGSVDIVLDSNSNYSQIINQTNAVSLVDSPTLNITLGSGFTPAVGSSFDIINSQGGAVNGTFAGLAEGSSFSAGDERFSISYLGGSGNEVVLTALGSTSTVPPTTQGVTITSPAQAAVLTAKAASLSVSATDTSTTLDDGLKYTWSIVKLPSGAKTPIFSANGTHAASAVTASFSKDGTYHFRVTVADANGHEATSDVDYVVHQKARGLRVTPHDATIKNGDSLQYTTTALDQFSHPMRVNSTPTYTLVQGSGSVTSGGLFTAGAKDGRITLDVLLDGIEGSIAGTVI